MAKVKIDTKAIPGFEELTEEQKAAISAIEVDVPEPDYSGYVKKEVFDKKAAEASDLSKQLKSKMSEAEVAEADKQKALSDMQNELAALKKEKTLTTYKAKFLALGYSEELATETASAMVDGNTDVVFANQKTFLEEREKVISAKALNQQPELSVGDPLATQSIEKQEMAKLRSDFGLPPI